MGQKLDATWELQSDITKRFPEFPIDSRGQEFSEGEGIDMNKSQLVNRSQN